MGKTPQTPAATWADLMAESARFVTERLEANMEMQQALLACRTPDELLQVQARFIRTAMEQYAGEVARTYRVTASRMGGGAGRARSFASREYDDIPV